MLLKGESVTKDFGGLTAVDHVDFQLEEGEIVGLIGPNGAGKTTLINLVSGILPVTEGEIEYKGTSINGLSPNRVAELGIARTFQIVRPFLGMTVKENVGVGAMFGKLGGNGTRKSPPGALGEAEEVLDFVGLENKKDMLAESLTVPDRKRLEMAKALAMHPDVILFDEVMAGLNPSEVDDAIKIIRKIRDERGKTILVIEHVMRAIVGVSERVFVLHHGKKIADGDPERVMNDERVIKAYLGDRWDGYAKN